MKTRFIQIKKISQIDTTRISVYDLGNRYIDDNGNMWGLRYNRDTRKIEVIRIMRTAAKNAQYFANQMRDSQRQRSAVPVEELRQDADYRMDHVSPADDDTEEFGEEHHEVSAPEEEEAETVGTHRQFQPDFFIDNRMREIHTLKERIKGIILNFSSSRVVSHEDKELFAQIDDLLRNLELEAQSHVEHLHNTFKEHREYPRSLNFYLSKLDKHAREIVHYLPTDEVRMRYVYLYEIHDWFARLYGSLDKNLTGIKTFLLKLSGERVQKLSTNEKKHLEDTRTTVNNTLEDVHTIQSMIKDFKDYINDPESLLR
jgi:hypothetical protein